MRPEAVFLDLDGVINDGALPSTGYVRLMRRPRARARWYAHGLAPGEYRFDGAAAAIRALAEEFQLYTATGRPSWIARANLDQIRVSHLFGVLCGPDLTGSNKWHDPNFYMRLFDGAGVEPARAVVVDDSPELLARARAAGARTLLVDGEAHGAVPEGGLLIANIVQLPGVLSSLQV